MSGEKVVQALKFSMNVNCSLHAMNNFARDVH